MEGGRGGGRGKGKKSKNAKKKAAAAAAAAAKKVQANSSSVQVVTVSTAPEAAAAHEPMAKSKRKRLKKLLKAAKAQQVNKSPTASSPKSKVEVPTQAATAAARPHVVSLPSKKKKKRKRNVSESEENVAETSAKEEQTSEGKKSPATGIKKKIVVLSHSGASPTTAKSKQQGVEKEIAVKAVEKVLSPRKVVNKVKAKAAVVSPKEVQPVVRKTQAKTEKNLNVVVGVSKSTAVTTSPKTTELVAPLTRKSGQVNTSASQQTHAFKEEKSDESCSTSLLSHVVAIPKKVSVKESNPERELESTGNDKPAHSGSVLNAVVSTPIAFSKQVDTTPVLASAVSSTPGHATALGSVSTGATGSPANTIPELDQSVTSALAGKKTSTLTSGSLKRRRSVDQAPTSTCLQPPAKRSMVSSEVGQLIAAEESGSRDIRANTPDSVPQTRIQQAKPRTQASNTEIHSTDSSTQVEGDAFTATSANRTLPSARPSPTRDIGGQNPVSEVRSMVQSAGNRPLKTAAERKISAVRIQKPIDKQLKPQAGTSPTLGKIKDVTPGSMTKVPSRRDSNSSTVEIVMDSHAYVEKMMKSELDMKKSGGSRDNPEQQAVTLPTRPQNAWGASFGMVPPSTVATRSARSLSTTPLSSWFLSKGCANFVKHVHFSDDEEDDCSNSGDFTGRPPTPRMISKASPKWRASSAKKNAFLESLTARSNWRTWYGSVDVHNLLDPPLAFVPEELRIHEVTPLSLPEPVTANTVTKKTSALELLETDIK